jgi:hypothetical protein
MLQALVGLRTPAKARRGFDGLGDASCIDRGITFRRRSRFLTSCASSSSIRDRELLVLEARHEQLQGLEVKLSERHAWLASR